MPSVAAEDMEDPERSVASEPVPPRQSRPLGLRYGLAVAVVLLALLLQWLLIPLFGAGPNASPFAVFFAAIMVAAWFGGRGPGLLATGLSALLAWFLFLAPQYSLAVGTVGQGLRVVVFGLEGLLISLLAGEMHTARSLADASARRARQNEEVLRLSEERLRMALESTALGTWELDPGTKEIRMDDRSRAVLGLAPDGKVTDEALLARAHPDYREQVSGLVRWTMAGGRAYSVEYRTVPLEEGTERWIEAQRRTFFDASGRATRIVGTILDITERKRAEQELQVRARQQEAVARLGQQALETTDLPGLLRSAVEAVTRVLDVEYAKVLELLPGNQELLVREGVGWKAERVGRVKVSADPDSQAGFTLLTEEPIIVEDLPSETRFSGHYLLHDHGVVSGMTVLIDPGGNPFGVLGAHTKERRAFTEDDANFLRAVANVLAAAIERERFEETQRFLAKVSALLSSSLDYRATLARAARLAVPTLADWCAVDVLEAGSIDRLAVAHADPEKVALAMELQERYPPDPDDPRGVPNVLRTGRLEFHPEITDEMLEAVARDEEHLENLRVVGFTSSIIVPMVARDRTLGAIILVSAESGRRYGEADLRLAEELARRAALAVDNARLYEEARKEITERRWAEEELRDSRDQLEAILRGVADGVTAQDPTGRVVYANEVAARIAGYPSVSAMLEPAFAERVERFEIEDESGRPFPPERLPSQRALRGEEGAEEVLRFRMPATGEERWTVVKALPVFGERGEVRLAVNIFRDITESRHAEEAMREMREAERRRIAHDLHDGVLQDLSYTAALMGLMMLEAEGTKLEGELQRSIDAVRRAGRGLRDAVNDLRLEEELNRPFPELVEPLVKRNREMSPGREIALDVQEGFPTAPLGEASTQLLRLIQEAMTNARRHSAAEKLAVTLRREGSDLIVEVKDDGQGFLPETASGVGLGSMRERAAAVGGELEIESSLGRGTIVRVRAPFPREGG